MANKRDSVRLAWGVFLLLMIFQSVFAQSRLETIPKDKEAYMKAYISYPTEKEALRWVETQGRNFIYVGKEELFPGLAKALKGKGLKVYVDAKTKSLPWLDKAGVRYTLVTMPGEMAGGGKGVLIAPDAYVLGWNAEEKRFVLVTAKEVANILYRMFTVYEAFAVAREEK